MNYKWGMSRMTLLSACAGASRRRYRWAKTTSVSGCFLVVVRWMSAMTQVGRDAPPESRHVNLAVVRIRRSV